MPIRAEPNNARVAPNAWCVSKPHGAHSLLGTHRLLLRTKSLTELQSHAAHALTPDYQRSPGHLLVAQTCSGSEHKTSSGVYVDVRTPGYGHLPLTPIPTLSLAAAAILWVCPG